MGDNRGFSHFTLGPLLSHLGINAPFWGKCNAPRALNRTFPYISSAVNAHFSTSQLALEYKARCPFCDKLPLMFIQLQNIYLQLRLTLPNGQRNFFKIFYPQGTSYPLCPNFKGNSSCQRNGGIQLIQGMETRPKCSVLVYDN